MDDHGKERREYSRIPASLHCVLKFLGVPSKEIVGVAEDVSYKGMRFNGKIPDSEIGHACLVSLYLGDENVTPIVEAAAKIVRKEGNKIGLKIEEISYYSDEHMKNLLLYGALTVDPEKIEGELKR